MPQDIAKQRRSEIEEMTGLVVREGAPQSTPQACRDLPLLAFLEERFSKSVSDSLLGRPFTSNLPLLVFSTARTLIIYSRRSSMGPYVH